MKVFYVHCLLVTKEISHRLDLACKVTENLRVEEITSSSVMRKRTHSVHLPPPSFWWGGGGGGGGGEGGGGVGRPSFGGGGGGLTGSQFLEGGCWERGSDIFQGGLQFLHKKEKKISKI